MWQDKVLSVGNLVFIAALVPMLWQRGKPGLITSIPTCLALAGFGVCYWTLGARMGAVMALTAAALWGVLAVQRVVGVGA